jgi:hypothetical protein
MKLITILLTEILRQLFWLRQEARNRDPHERIYAEPDDEWINDLVRENS